MKIKRHGLKEKNKITAMWLFEFAHDLDKNAQNIDYLKDYLDKVHKNKRFNSIDEKLADIKERIGFDLTQKVVNEIEKISNEKLANHDHNSASNSCGCNSASNSCSCPVKTAMTHPPRDVELMSNILKYIKDMIQHEPHLDSATILSRCKDEDGLRFVDLEKKIDREKLVSYIKDLLKSQDNDSNNSLVSYTPSDDKENSSVDSDNSIADYYGHAEPSLS